MIGIFDSGAGGLTALSEIRKLAPSADVCFFADYQNAPYGTKSKKELIQLVSADIFKLREAGAEKILMACCTASTVYKYLSVEARDAALPIIEPTAKKAIQTTKNGKIGVIGTNATVASREFSKSLFSHREVSAVFELPTQNLVSAVESGICDGNITKGQREALFSTLLPLRKKGIDTLILGCTHFARLEREIGGCLPGVTIVNSSREGAKEMLKIYSPHKYGCGKTVYL